MTANKPIYLLFCEGHTGQRGNHPMDERGRWRFVLENIETGEKVEASDSETVSHPDRTSLIAVMRGLEALDQPSRVTLITTNRYVARGLQYGLVEWRENDYCWEHFGSVQPVRNADLWRRIDGALRYHEVHCRWMAEDAATDGVSEDARTVPIVTIEDGSAPEVGGDAERAPARPHAFPRGGAEIMRGQRAGVRRERSFALVSSRESECEENSTEDACGVERVADGELRWGARADANDGHGYDGGMSGAPERIQQGVSGPIRWVSGSVAIEDDRSVDYFRPALESEVAIEEGSGVEPTSALGLAAYASAGIGAMPEATQVPSLIRRPMVPWIVRTPMRWLWGGVLALDAFLVSCLQCMLLLDPRREEFRTRKR